MVLWFITHTKHRGKRKRTRIVEGAGFDLTIWLHLFPAKIVEGVGFDLPCGLTFFQLKSLRVVEFHLTMWLDHVLVFP